MLNKLWAGMILLGVIWACVNGTISEVTEQILVSAESAVQLSITMLGVVAMWTGVMKIAEKAGILEQLTKFFHPFLSWIFPRIPKNHAAMSAIGLNIIANVLGLGWAATPAGLQAMEKLSELEEERRERNDKLAVKQSIASNEMCIFLILNISSLQLIPVNLIAYRIQYGSTNPAVVVGPALIATFVSTIVGIIFCKIMDKNSIHNQDFRV